MKKKFALSSFIFLINLSLLAQSDTITQRIVLIGDAGQLTNGRHPVVDAVRKNIKLDAKTTVLFLGDNLYKTGLPDDRSLNYNTAKAILDSQLSVAEKTPAKVYMIPGNHDWNNGHRGGLDAIIRQQLYVDFLRIPNVKYYPEDGCPGPVEVNLGNDVTLILFDSQWWIHAYDKPEIESDCNCKTKEELVTQIADIASRNSKKLVVLACHHPFKSNGMHGGYYTFKQHIFPLTDIKKKLYIPLPVIGSIYPIARSVFGTPQDLMHPNYANMISEISTAIKAAAPNIVFVSGHDHNLQHIKDGGYNYIVSGGGCKQNRTSKNKNSLYNATAMGFSVMEVSRNKNATISFYTVEDSVTKDYTATLLNFSKLPETALDSAAQKVEDPFLKYKDTVTISASSDFKPVKGLKRFFMGQNYRPEWSVPVNMNVFNISNYNGGFDILSLGGGKQTKSLRLRNRKTGKEWVLRSMNKNPTKAIPETFRGTLAADLVTELNSASHPYAALAMPGLASALNISTAKPQLFFVPDDPALGFYRPLFANNVCMLEERHGTADNSETRTSAKLFNKMLEDNDHRPDSLQVLKARLLDILVGDFDRHLDQWRWGTVDSTKGKDVKGRIYHPIPRDRDQALFYSDGFVLRMVSGRAMPFLKGFRHDIPKVNWLSYSARDFDRTFLPDLDKKDWEKTVAQVQQSLTDSVIRQSVAQMPKEAFAISGEKIIQKMISRRSVLDEAAMKYYNFISKQVNIIGSNEKEYFKVNNTDDGGLRVRMYGRSKEADTSFIIYDRVFTSAETKEIRLFGLNDDDKFDIAPDASSRIKIRIIGGKGYDTFDIKGSVECLLYDVETEGNIIINSSHAKNRFSIDPPVNDRNIISYNYNTTKFPRLQIGYNSDDGFMIGGGISRTTYGFRNTPYATDQRLTALYAVNRKALQLSYRGEFNHISRSTDLVVGIKYADPSLRNFFGYGNTTSINENLPFTYYQTRYKSFEIEALFRKRLFEKLQLMAGPYFYQYNSKYSNNTTTVLGKFRDLNLDSADIFSKKKYFGAKAVMHFDNRNHEVFPTRGIQWNNEFVSLFGMGGNSKNLFRYTGDMTIYASFNDPAKAVLVLGIGGGHVFGNNYAYFQAVTVGMNNNLQGFRKNRYAGTSSLYASMELRLQLLNINSYILPGTLGISGFYNAGRVWLKNQPSKKWHGAYGAGIYFIPFNLFTISAMAGFDRTEKVFNFSLGTKINLTY